MVQIMEFNALYTDKVIDLILNIQQSEFHIPITLNDQPDLNNIEGFYQKKGNFWIALDNNDVVGSIAIKDIGNGDAVLRKMFVKHDYRGKEKGVSHGLLNTLMEWARQRQYDTIYLGTTLQFQAAHRFYDKYKFIEIDRKDLPETFPVMEVDKKFFRYRLL
jgi:N-acetylglutamate synthase-like GNAT family acetyltransferase